MSDERTFCGICGVATFDGGSHCEAHKQAPTVERTWCDVCGVATERAALCPTHEARKLAERQGAAYCERCGRRSPCELHDGAGDELEEDGDVSLENDDGEGRDDWRGARGDDPPAELEGRDNPAAVAVAIAKTPIVHGHGRRKGKRR